MSRTWSRLNVGQGQGRQGHIQGCQVVMKVKVDVIQGHSRLFKVIVDVFKLLGILRSGT